MVIFYEEIYDFDSDDDFLGMSFISPTENVETKARLISNSTNMLPIGSDEDLYHDIFISLLI